MPDRKEKHKVVEQKRREKVLAHRILARDSDLNINKANRGKQFLDVIKEFISPRGQRESRCSTDVNDRRQRSSLLNCRSDFTSCVNSFLCLYRVFIYVFERA
jgi:hypothetical protein